MKRSVKIVVRNDSSEPTTLWLEPWGEDYGMAAGDKFEIVATNVEEDFYFHIDVGDEIKVWAERQVTDIVVLKSGTRIGCGYNRHVE